MKSVPPELFKLLPLPIQWGIGTAIVIGSLSASYIGIVNARQTAKSDDVMPPLQRMERHLVDLAERARVNDENLNLISAYICQDNGGCPFEGMPESGPGWIPQPLSGRNERHKSAARWAKRRPILDCGPDGYRAERCPGPLD